MTSSSGFGMDFLKNHGKASLAAAATAIGSGLRISSDVIERQKNIAQYFDLKNTALDQSLKREQKNNQNKVEIYKARVLKKISGPDALLALEDLNNANKKEATVQRTLCDTSYPTYKKQKGLNINFPPKSDDISGPVPPFGSISSQYLYKNRLNTFMEFQCSEFVPEVPKSNLFFEFGVILTIFITVFYFTNFMFQFFKIEKKLDASFQEKNSWWLSILGVLLFPFFLLLMLIGIIWEKLFTTSDKL